MKTMAIIFGVVFLAVGALGFVPAAAPDGHLLGIFHVNPAHNFFHILSGAVALICAATSFRAARLFFQIFGVIYGLLAVLGFLSGDEPLLGVVANNLADAWLHAAIAAVALYLGFVHSEAKAVANRA